MFVCSFIYTAKLTSSTIFNCRFFELMATKTFILCPKSVENYGILYDNYNAVMFNDNFSDLEEKLHLIIDEKINYEKIIEQAYHDVKNYTYSKVIDKVISYTSTNT